VNGLIPDRTFFRIGDVAEIIGLKTFVIRFWEREFPFLAPEKGPNGHRVYRRSQIEALLLVKHLLHIERYSIEGARKRIAELRKAGKLREAIDELMQKTGARDLLAAGSVIPKSEIESLNQIESLDALESSLQDLQSLIRDPAHAGIDVPGLKTIQ